jgi:hypothetical protein
MIVWVTHNFDGSISRIYDRFEDAKCDRMDYIESFSGPMEVGGLTRMAKEIITSRRILSNYA